jgi:hypothetical protein
MKLVTPNVGAKHKLLFNKPEAGLLNKCSCLAAALGATKFIGVIVMNLVTLCCVT